MLDRTLPFEGIYNFRDYGGYGLVGGGRLRDSRLYRSAQLGAATADDLRLLDGLKLAAVVDLRNPGERKNEPSRFPPGFAAKIFDSDIEAGAVAPHVGAAIQDATSAEKARAAMRAVFADLPFRSAMMAGLRNYFAALAEFDGPNLIHCTVGKDRTGIAVALLQATLGVHHDDVMADFLLTNTAGRFEERLASDVAKVRKNYGPHFPEDAARALASVEPDFLDATFATIHQRHGDVESYLRDEVGIDPAMLELAKQRLIA